MSDMGKYNLGAEALVDQAESFKTFLGLNQPEPGDKFFLVMGLTGAGKSTFVSNCTGHDVTIGHGLYSCTNSIGAFQYTRRGQRIFLIDTPGFSDTSRSDIETLEVLATYLAASYANGVRIHGIITLYPITNNRMAGSNLRSLRILKDICGFASYSNLAIVTTMWPDDLVSQGARTFRDYDERHSPANSEQRIIDTLLRHLEHGQHAVLQLQREVVDEGKSLGETTAGIAASEHLNQTCRKHENQLRILDAEMEKTSSSSEQEYSLQLQELKAEVGREIEKTKRGRQALVKTMIDLHETETKALKQRVSNLQSQYEAEVQNKEMILRDVQESCAALQKEIARLANSPRQQQIVARQTKSHQKALSKAQKDAAKIRKDRQKVQGYTKEIVGGVMNGIAAGAVASVMGGLMCIVM